MNEMEHLPGNTAPKQRHVGAIIALGLLSFLACVLFFAERWLMSTWESLSPDEIFYHLSAPLTGTDTYTIWEFVLHYLPPLLFVFGILVATLIFGRKKDKFLPAAVLVALASLLMMGMAFADFYEQTDLGAYLNNSGRDFIEEHYIDPREVEITFPEKKRNLIYIFLESMEITCTDRAHGGAFDENVVPDLTSIALDSQSFNGDSDILNGAITTPGANWTMGGMFAQTSGLPLKLAIGGNELPSLGSFFPSLITLGDVLEEQGYQSVLLIGSDAAFGGRDLYFSEHGNYAIHDYNYAIETGAIPEDYHTWWGYEDEKLFEFTRDHLLELAHGDQPFNLTILTADTHFEDGYICRLCQNEFGDNRYANVHACSSRQVSELVAWIQQQDFYENTTIILCGDHTSMDRDFYADVPADYQRKVYTTIINGAAEASAPQERVYTSFDMFPTTLAAMGVSIPGDKLGLGVNLYSTTATLAEELGVDSLNSHLSKMSAFLETFGTTITITEDSMKAFAETAVIFLEEHSESETDVILAPCAAINPDALESAWIRITNPDTGEVVIIPLVKEIDALDANSYKMTCVAEFPLSDFDHLQVEAFVTAGDFDDYLAATHNI